MKKEAEKIRNNGSKDRRIRKRKTKNILKIIRRLLETTLEENMKKEAEKIRKHRKKTRILGNCSKDYSRSKTGRQE